MRNEVIVRKLIVYADKILGYCDGVSYDGFCGDSKLVDACVFNLSLRNRIVHDYEGVNLQLIWEIIHDDLPGLREELTRL